MHSRKGWGTMHTTLILDCRDTQRGRGLSWRAEYQREGKA